METNIQLINIRLFNFMIYFMIIVTLGDLQITSHNALNDSQVTKL